MNRLLLVPLVLALSACVSDPAPLEQLRLTEQTLAQAQTMGVSIEQSESLRLAQDKFSRAQQALQDGRNKEARLLAEQSELDARLAEAEQVNAKGREQLAEINQRITRLRQQLGAL
ncbi:hypothetical protein NCCP436_12380 [Pseudomonas sp. NCCP-436]|nr:DUF4398 domain-containing protein [Pseudomonas sp. NCCP-436]GIZ11822.1 hypothetical protein NCCP436_12380 [Pseudomonas sp. NCCP-436]